MTYTYPETEGSAYVWTINEGEIVSGDGTSEVTVIWWGNWQGTLCTEFNMCDECINMSCVNVNIVNSIDEHGIGDVLIFPNPARHQLFIEFDRYQTTSTFP